MYKCRECRVIIVEYINNICNFYMCNKIFYKIYKINYKIYATFQQYIFLNLPQHMWPHDVSGP